MPLQINIHEPASMPTCFTCNYITLLLYASSPGSTRYVLLNWRLFITDTTLQMPLTWTTNEQKAFRKEELVRFKQIGGKHYTKWWPILYKKWGKKWPEHCIVFPSIPVDVKLTEDQHKILSSAVLCCQDQIHHWMHWHNSSRLTCAANKKICKIMDSLLKNKTCARKPWELYSNRYYKTCILPHIKPGMMISKVNKIIHMIFDNKSHGSSSDSARSKKRPL